MSEVPLHIVTFRRVMVWGQGSRVTEINLATVCRVDSLPLCYTPLEPTFDPDSCTTKPPPYTT